MKNNKALFYTATLDALWDTAQKDSIDLLIPFIETIINDRFGKVGSEIDMTKLEEDLQSYGFQSFPIVIVKRAIHRLLKKGLISRTGDKYFVKKSFEKYADRFTANYNAAKTSVNLVLYSLAEFLSQHSKSAAGISLDKTKEYLIHYFELKGYFTSIDIFNLNDEYSNITEMNISRFIIDKFQNDKDMYNNIIKMVHGFYLSKVLYFQLENSDIRTSRFKDVTFYFDTTLMLYVLGLKDTYSNKMGSYLYDTIRKLDGKVKIFRQVYDEIYRIIDAYRHQKFGSSQGVTGFIEMFENEHYSSNDINVYLLSLKQILAQKNIDIVDNPPYPTNSEYYKVFDEGKLENCIRTAYRITKEISGNSKDKVIERDVKSISSVFRIRDGKPYCSTIEKCQAVFVTTNYRLCKTANKFFRKEYADYFKNQVSRGINITISATDLSAIVWIKSSNHDNNLAEIEMIQLANSALEPTTQLISNVRSKIDILQRQGKITPDFAKLLNSNYILMKDEQIENGCDESGITEQDVYERSQKIAKQEFLNGENTAIEIIRKSKETAEVVISSKTNKYYEKTKKHYQTICKVAFVVLAIILIISSILSVQLNSNLILTFILIIGTIFSILGIIYDMKGKFQLVNKKIEKIATCKADRYHKGLLNEEKEMHPELYK